MFKLKMTVLFSLASIILLANPSLSESIKVNPEKTISAFLEKNEVFKNVQTGIMIKNLDNGKVLLEKNANVLLTPASNIKIYTSLLALEKLGKDFQYETTLTTDGEIIANDFSKKIEGNLYLNFSGDPVFTNLQLKNLLNNLSETEINEISGKLIVNYNGFDQIPYGPGWMWDDFSECYSAPVKGITIDENCLRFSLRGSDDKSLSVETPNHVSVVTDELTINQADFSQVEINNDEQNPNQVKLIGTVAKGGKTDVEKSITNPENYLLKIINDTLPEKIIIHGGISFSNVSPISHKLLASEKSAPLSELLKRFNKESHNLIGELLLKTIAKKETGSGSTQNGSKIMKDYIETNFKGNQFKIVDGSGLSRYNLVPPKLTMSLLEYIYKKEEYRKVILEAFPIGGEEGTLKNRLKNLKNTQIIAKSGSMSAVNCLSGYLINKKKRLAFSIMINNTVLSGKELRDYQDRILEIIATKESD